MHNGFGSHSFYDFDNVKVNLAPTRKVNLDLFDGARLAASDTVVTLRHLLILARALLNEVVDSDYSLTTWIMCGSDYMGRLCGQRDRRLFLCTRELNVIGRDRKLRVVRNGNEARYFSHFGGLK